MTLTFDREGCSHLSATGLHDDTARVAEVLLRGFRDADALADAATNAPRRRSRRRGDNYVLATAHSDRVHLTLVARPTRKRER